MRLLSGLLLASALSAAHAQTFEVKGYAEAATVFPNLNPAQASAAPLLDGELSLKLTAGPWKALGTLNPWWRLAPTLTGSFGLTESYLQYDRPDLSFAVGVQRTVIETARLGFPYLLDKVDPVSQQHLGRPAISLSWTPERWRTRLVLLQDDQGITPVFSVRHEFAQVDVEGHVLWRDGSLITGLGGSGTLGSVVLYGEGWALNNFSVGRWAAGVSGNLPRDKGLWTLETGLAPILSVVSSPAEYYLATQISAAPTDDQNVTLNAALWPKTQSGVGTLTYTKSQDNNEFRVFVAETVSGGQWQTSAGLGFRHYFAWNKTQGAP